MEQLAAVGRSEERLHSQLASETAAVRDAQSQYMTESHLVLQLRTVNEQSERDHSQQLAVHRELEDGITASRELQSAMQLSKAAMLMA